MPFLDCVQTCIQNVDFIQNEATFRALAIKTTTQPGSSTDCAERFAQEEIGTVLDGYVLGATETTASTLGWMLHFLAKDADAFAAARGEAQRFVSLSGEASAALASAKHFAADKLPFINAVVHEALRIHPPVDGVLFTHVAQKPFEAFGKNFPRGTAVVPLFKVRGSEF